MSKHETPMTRWYWKQVGGTLVEEFCAVQRSDARAVRLLDGVIIRGGNRRRARQSDVSVEGRDIIVVQAKHRRLSMSLMGQALFSARLMREFHPRSIESVALVTEDDDALRSLLEPFPDVCVVVYEDEKTIKKVTKSRLNFLRSLC